MDLNEIKENYKRFDDYKIEKIASEDAASLRPEVIEILKDEIIRRNLGDSLLNSIQSQTKQLTSSEFNEYCSILKQHACPICNTKASELNVILIGEVVSIVILTQYEKRLKIACSACLDELIKKANIKSALFGWWGFPSGPIQTIRSFIFNSKMKGNDTEGKAKVFNGFVLENIGFIEESRSNPEKLTEFLKRTNNRI